MVDSDDGRQVPVVQAYAYGKYLGYLNVVFDKNGNVVEAVGNPILLDSSVPEGKWPRRESACSTTVQVLLCQIYRTVAKEFSFLPELAVLLCVGFGLGCSCAHLLLFLNLNSGLWICTNSV